MNTKDVLSAVSSHLSNASPASAEPPKPTPMEQVLREVASFFGCETEKPEASTIDSAVMEYLEESRVEKRQRRR